MHIVMKVRRIQHALVRPTARRAFPIWDAEVLQPIPRILQRGVQWTCSPVLMEQTKSKKYLSIDFIEYKFEILQVGRNPDADCAFHPCPGEGTDPPPAGTGCILSDGTDCCSAVAAECETTCGPYSDT